MAGTLRDFCQTKDGVTKMLDFLGWLQEEGSSIQYGAEIALLSLMGHSPFQIAELFQRSRRGTESKLERIVHLAQKHFEEESGAL